MTEHSFLGSNINLVKAHNLRAILLSLLHEGQLSRIQLAHKTSLSTTAITNLVAELLEQGVISEESNQNQAPDEPRPVGRPRTGLHLIPNARYAIGVHIGVGMFRVAIVNLCDEILHNRTEEFSLGTPAEHVLDRITHQIEAIITENKIERKRILGIGVGASGLVDFRSGINILAPNLGWRTVPIRDIMQKATGISVTMDNNVRAMALGEAYFGVGRGVDSLAFVYGRTGVGAGFVVDGKVFRGPGAGAGEIGHVIMVPENGAPCRCGQHGCLETLVSEQVIVRQAEQIAQRKPDGCLAKLLHSPGNLRPIEAVFQAARQCDEEASQMVEKTGCYLGIALANLVNILNPELILLGGMFAQAEDLILPTAARTMRERAFAGLGEKVRLQTTSFGWRAGVIGAAALALMEFFYHQTP